MGAEKVTAMRGTVWKPSSSSINCTSWQSLGAAAQSEGRGRFTRRPDFCVASGMVRKSFGKGPVAGFVGSHRTVTPLANSAGANSASRKTAGAEAIWRMVNRIHHRPGGHDSGFGENWKGLWNFDF